MSAGEDLPNQCQLRLNVSCLYLLLFARKHQAVMINEVKSAMPVYMNNCTDAWT